MTLTFTTILAFHTCVITGLWAITREMTGYVDYQILVVRLGICLLTFIAIAAGSIVRILWLVTLL